MTTIERVPGARRVGFRWLVRTLAAALFVGALAAPGPGLAGPRPKGKVLVGVVNLNVATHEQLEMLPGVGPAKAQRIVEAREKKPFRRAWDVTRVKGIGPAFFRKHRELLRVDGETTLAWVDAAPSPGSGEFERDRDLPAAEQAAEEAQAP